MEMRRGDEVEVMRRGGLGGEEVWKVGGWVGRRGRKGADRGGA